MTNSEHETCDDEACEVCIERERVAARKHRPGVDRALRRLAQFVERRRRRPRA